ncbi:MAG: DUF3501 family protein [Pseudomonadota bacterium]|nr:DUF3501 family protein [Pseudomonadota bacterium]
MEQIRMQREILDKDIMSMSDYSAIRREHATKLADEKKNRRVEIGPACTFYFESYDTMWFQVHEMLYIEKGGEEQVPGELQAYNPLIPKGQELVATVMIEVGDPDRRAALLAKLGGFEETITMSVDGDIIRGVAEEDVDRTTADGKASSVQFLRFPFTDTQIADFKDQEKDVILSIGHIDYHHMAGVPYDVRMALAADFD